MKPRGMYVLGLPFTRTRKSSFLDGVGPDAQFLSAHLAAHLNGQATDRIERTAPRNATRRERLYA
jgi:hypothetical protein